MLDDSCEAIMANGFAVWRERSLAVSHRLSLWLASALLLGSVLVILYGVSMRYVMGGAPIWMDELARFLIIATVMLALGAVWVEGEHMRVSLIERLLPAGLTKALVVYQWLLTLLLMATATWFSLQYALSTSMFTTMGLGISRSIPLMSLPIGFALLTWQALWYGPLPLKTELEEVSL